MVERVRASQAFVSDALQALNNLTGTAESIRPKLEARAAIDALLSDSLAIAGNISEVSAKLDLLAARFGRKTLNIGVVGNAGQGKSTLIQSMTGLDKSVVPSGAKGHCTGAPSTVANHDLDETYAIIHFHTERSFLHEVVAPYYKMLNLGVAPASMDEFQRIDLRVESNGQATNDQYLERLKFVQNNLKYFRDLLNRGKLKVVKKDIRAYIAQDDETGERSDRNGIPYCKWLAVEIAEIYCRFPTKDIGSITLSDTPGLGDFVSGAEERLVEVVGKNLDSIVFLKKPPPLRPVLEKCDTAVYDLIARKVIRGLHAKNWSYFLLNRVESEEFKNSGVIEDYKELIRGSKMETRALFDADCSNPDSVSECLNEILNDMADGIGPVDERLFVLHLEEISKLSADLTNFSKKAFEALPSAGIKAGGLELFNREFGQTWQNLAHRLNGVVKEYRKKRDEPDEKFLAALKEIYTEMEKGPVLPSAGEVEKQAAAGGLIKWQADEFHRLRVEISKRFERLNSGLDEGFDEVKGKLVDALMLEEWGRLGLIQKDEQVSSLDNIKELWKGHADADLVLSAIELLEANRLSFRSFIQPRVRGSLDCLDENCPSHNHFQVRAGESPSDALDKLSAAWDVACRDARKAILELAKEPSMARFAAAEDFADAILREGGADRAKERWSNFYSENRSEIWPAQFQALEANTRLRKQWQDVCEILQNAARNLQVMERRPVISTQ